jgi:hypothetical protein
MGKTLRIMNNRFFRARWRTRRLLAGAAMELGMGYVPLAVVFVGGRGTVNASGQAAMWALSSAVRAADS